MMSTTASDLGIIRKCFRAFQSIILNPTGISKPANTGIGM
jgi:hypothetical protein